MTAFSLGARLSLGANSALALSLPQSFVVAKRRQNPAPSSEGAKAAPPQTAEFTAAAHSYYSLRRTSHAEVILINLEEHSQQGSEELRAAPDDDFHKKHLRQNFFSGSVKTQ